MQKKIIQTRMAFFTKADLKFNYSWKAKQEGDNPNLTGHPDRDLIDRNEGYEVLYYINKVAQESNWTSKSSGHKLERMLKEVPGSLRSRKNITNWMIQNWNNYN
jgi:hypothetical protein